MTATQIESRLAAHGISLPAPARSVANYLPYALSGKLLHTSGQLPLRDGALTAVGQLGPELDLAAGRKRSSRPTDPTASGSTGTPPTETN